MSTTVGRGAGTAPAGPGPVSTQPYVSTERTVRDAVPWLTAFLVLLLALPSTLVVEPLGAVGTPATLSGLLLLAWWLTARITVAGRLTRGRQPLRTVLCLFVLTQLASCLAAVARGAPADELSSADRGLIALAAWCGIALMACDGIRSREQLDVLVERIVLGATALAALGVFQFFTGFDLAAHVRVPGLTVHDELGSLLDRSYFRRVAGTARHPIEFGVVLAVALPLALHLALSPVRSARATRWWAATLLIGAAIPMSLSRSAVLGTFTVLVLLMTGWSSTRRAKAMLVLPVFLVVMRLLVPGLLGTIRGLFVNINDDPSTQGRTDDYAAVGPYLRQSPWTGRGLSTFLPERYRVLDNQYLGSLIETGALGVAALLLLFAVAYALCRSTRRRSRDGETRELAQALAAGVLCAGVSFVTFDAFGFSMVTGLLFLVLGCCGALWRLEEERRA